MIVEINSAPGQFPALTAKMLRLELEAAGIAVSETQQSPPALYIYVDSSGSAELSRQKQREPVKAVADDRYFKYPFRTDAFVAAVKRIEAEAPRDKTGAASPEVPTVKTDEKEAAVPDLTINEAERLITADGVSAQFTEREYRLFKYLYERRGKAVSRGELVAAVWDGEAGNGTNVVEVYISYLRRKLEGTALERRIRTRRGQGYEFNK